MRVIIGIDEVGGAATPRKGGRASPTPYVIGIDEVGRGPLAGPVVLAAVAIPVSWRPREGGGRGSLRDSKRLTAIQRELWSGYLTAHHKVVFATAKIYPRAIDRLNIARAANKAARRALRKVLASLGGDAELAGVYLDGGLYLQQLRAPRARASFHSETVRFAAKVAVTAHTVVKGDERIVAVKIASILAKAQRDRIMANEAKRFPGYGFERHKGYATKSHYAALAKLGPTPIHRLTFL